ncbi:Hsp20/alpha crystallin family protein [candidate division KSB1 bacterium]|nr:Hsp20/alpha crystallin family protein [candidate division KSB1 bacterium]
MSLVRWSPARELLNIRSDFDRVFNRFFDHDALETSYRSGAWEPAVDISETADEYQIHADLPGLTKDEVKINYEDGVISIRGEKKQEKEDKQKNYHRLERSYGMFERSFRLPNRVEIGKIEAKFKDGVLTLRLPKSEEAKPKEIPIRIS